MKVTSIDSSIIVLFSSSLVLDKLFFLAYHSFKDKCCSWNVKFKEFIRLSLSHFCFSGKISAKNSIKRHFVRRKFNLPSSQYPTHIRFFRFFDNYILCFVPWTLLFITRRMRLQNVLELQLTFVLLCIHALEAFSCLFRICFFTFFLIAISITYITSTD